MSGPASASQPLCAAIYAKVAEQIERTEHLLELLPADGIDWSPPMERAWTNHRLLEHMLDVLAGFCAVLMAAEPERLAHFETVKAMFPMRGLAYEEMRRRFRELSSYVKEGFSVLNDVTLSRPIPTVFVPEGEPVMTLLLGNLEHLINHKHQLFVHLRLMNIDVSTSDLYQFRNVARPVS